MKNWPTILSAVIAVTVTVAPVQADTTEAPACAKLDSHVALLEAGHKEPVMTQLLDGSAADICVRSTNANAAKAWFAVLFHPTFVEALVDESDARKTSWDALVSLIESQYLARRAPKPEG